MNSRTGVAPAKLNSYPAKAVHVDGDCRTVYDELSAAGIQLGDDGIDFLFGTHSNPGSMQAVFVSPRRYSGF
jgi:hypothetical protein